MKCIKITKKRKEYSLENYDYEKSYIHSMNTLSESFIDSIFSTSRYKVNYHTKTIRSGNQFEVEIYPAFKFDSAIPETIVRSRRESRESQKNLDERNARKRLNRLVHSNFEAGDYWLHLTFDNDNLPETLEDAERLASNFFRRINRLRKKNGLDNAKYIYVVEEGEYGTERFHLHLVMDRELDVESVLSKWKHGSTTTKIINFYGDNSLMGICKYLSKDPEVYKKTAFRLKGKRRWGASKNLKQPKESVNKTKFSRAKVNGMIKNQNSIAEILENTYPEHNFKEVEIKYNDFNGLFYIYARMESKKYTRMRI